MGHFYEKRFGRPPSAGPIVSGCGMKIKIPLPNFFASSSHFWKGVTRPPAPKPREETNLLKSLFWGSRPDPEGPGVQTACRKITCKEFGDPEYLTTIWPWGQKLFHNVMVIDRHTNTLWISMGPLREKLFPILFYACGGWDTSNPAKFLPFHFVKLALLTSVVKD